MDCVLVNKHSIFFFFFRNLQMRLWKFHMVACDIIIKFLHRLKCCHWYPCLKDSDSPFQRIVIFLKKNSWSLFVLYMQIFFDISVLLNCTQAPLGVIVLNYSEQSTVHEFRIIVTGPAFGKVPIRKYATLANWVHFQRKHPVDSVDW